MKLLYIIAILLILFGGVFFEDSAVTVSYSLFIIYFIIGFFKKKKYITRIGNRYAVIILFVAFFSIIFKYSIGQDEFKNILCFLILPMMVSIALENNKQNYNAILQRILLMFFVFECGVAIYESIFKIYLFYDPTTEMSPEELLYSSPEDWQFRSHALLGHPLANAMYVDVMIAFILTSSIKLKNKLMYFILGVVSLFCFNARGAIIVASIILLPYAVYLINKQSNHKKIDRLTFLAFLCVILYIIIKKSGGGRLLNSGIYDGSAATRVQVYSFYQYITPTQFLLGGPDLYLIVMKKLGAGGVENGIITLILQYGFILTLIILISLLVFQIKKMKVYCRIDKIVIMLTFYLLGIMNPNLATSVQWTFWIMSYYAFHSEITVRAKKSNFL